MMKRILPFVAVAIMIIAASCRNTKKEDNANALQMQDTLGLAEYQKWKMESEIQNRLDQERLENQATAAPATTSRSSSRSSSARSSSRGGTYRSSGNGGASSESQGTVAQAPAPVPQRKKGMSHTAKGAIVGAASGAIIGAVANKKNRLGGGVVGGVIGAATGAGVGILVDKKERQRDGY